MIRETRLADIGRALGADAAVSRLLRGAELELYECWHVAREQLPAAISSREGLAICLLEEKRPVVVREAIGHPLTAWLYWLSQHQRRHFRFSSFAGAPLLHDGEPAGVLGVYRKRPGNPFGDEDGDRLAALAERYFQQIAPSERG